MILMKKRQSSYYNPQSLLPYQTYILLHICHPHFIFRATAYFKSKLRSKSNCKLWPQTLRLEGILILIYQMSFDIMTVCLDECYNAMKPNVRSIFPNLTILPFIKFFGGGGYVFLWNSDNGHLWRIFEGQSNIVITKKGHTGPDFLSWKLVIRNIFG